jgi:alkyl hydroperoxide reductase subunit AhpC
MNPWTSTFCRGVYHVVHKIIECEKKVRRVEQDNLNVFQAWDPIISLLEANKMFIQNYKVCPINKCLKKQDVNLQITMQIF